MRSAAREKGAMPGWQVSPSPADLARALAERIAGKLRQAVTDRGHALLAVSGGTTPEKFLRALSEVKLPWDRVAVTLVDERFVPPHSERSNEKLVRTNLLQGEASLAKFVGLYSDAVHVGRAAQRANENLSALPWPLDAAVLGMGIDGHTASFFPDAGNLSALLDPQLQEIVLTVHATSAGEPRLTLTLARLMESRFIALHIQGEAKRQILERALSGTGDHALPIEAIFRHARSPVEIFWAPDEDDAQ